MAPRLKVFVTSDGLTDYVVAVSSREKALTAWGVRQDLFKEGNAHETDDAALRDAALAEPGQVLRKPAAGRGALEKLKPVARPKPKTPSKAALKKVADAEKALRTAEGQASKAEGAVDEARERLAAAEAARSEAQAAVARLDGALSAARKALEG